MNPLVSVVVVGALSVLAPQEAPEQAVPAAPAVAAPEVTLQTGLEQLDWDPVRRGPLLLIAPDKLTLTGKTPLPPPRSGYGLPELVGYFEHQVVRLSTLTTAGPTQMVELSVPPPTDDLAQEYFRNPSPHAFLASLSPSQLQVAAGQNGIGYSDLSDERQRALWSKLFPATLDFRGSASLPASMTAGQTPWYGNKSLPVLSPAAQRALRVRLRSEVALSVAPGGYTVRLSEPLSGFLQVSLRTLPVSPDRLYEYQREQTKTKSGALKVPYRRKPSDLDLSLERFSTPIPLEGVKTVGELVQRAAQALRLELYADARLASQSVFVRTTPDQRVSAADALSAVLRATATTIRRLQAGQSGAFVITYDRVPLGNTSVVLFDGILPQEMSKMQEQLSEDKAQKLALVKLRQAKLLTTLPRGGGAELSEPLWKAALEGKETPFPLTELPGSASARVQAAWQARQGRPGPDGVPPPKAPQSVQPRASLLVQVLSPGLGEAQLATLSLRELIPQPETPRVELPDTFKTRGLRVRPPQTATEAKLLLTQARTRGFNTLYVALSGDANDDRGVSLLVAEKEPLPLVPTLSPLQPAPTDRQRERDISVTGRSAAEMAQGRPALGAIAQIIPFIVPLFEQITRLDALTPEAVPVERFAERVARLAALPGVVQIGLHDTAALGYRKEGERGLETLWTGGYSLPERLAFLRAKGIDPADFLEVNGPGNMGSLKLPFFSDNSLNHTLETAWSERRYARTLQLQRRLDAALLAARVGKPLTRLDGSSIFNGEQHWKPTKGGAGPLSLPYWEALTNFMPGLSTDAPDETSAIRKWLRQRLTPPPADAESLEMFGRGRVGAVGFVYDLSGLPLGEALTHLEAIVALKK